MGARRNFPSCASIIAEVLDDATSGPITIAKYDATSAGVPFQVEGLPTVTSISPAVAPVGATVTITGSGFGSTQSTSAVQFSGGTNAAGPTAATITSWSDTQIVATVAPGAVTGNLQVTVAGVSGAGLQLPINTTVQVTDSLNHVTSYTSEIMGGSWHYASSTGSGCSSCTVRGNRSNTLDGAGNVLSATDELGHVTSYTYDAAEDLASQSQQLDATDTATTSYTYNSFGEPLTVTR